MKIVMISSLWETTPPEKYGGTERVVGELTEELVKRGHDVTLFATGDSKTKAKLKSVYPRALYRDGVPWTDLMWPLMNVGKAMEYAKDTKADIIHSHCQYTGYPFGPISPVPMVSTHHGSLRQNIIDQRKIAMYELFKGNNYISISEDQRKPMPHLNWLGTVYNGVDTKSFAFSDKSDGYLAWIGRFTDKKGAKEAIEIATSLNMELRMAAKIEKNNSEDLAYYEKEIAPRIDGKKIKYIGEVGHKEKNELLKNAFCLINPIKWDEPFGLVPVEANACGCPSVVFDRGAMREIIKDGVNGFLVKPNDLEAMVESVKKVGSINRNDCRSYVEKNFSVQKMADDYLEIYERLRI